MKNFKQSIFFALLIFWGLFAKGQACTATFSVYNNSGYISFMVDTVGIRAVADSVEFLLSEPGGAFWGCRGTLAQAYSSAISSGGSGYTSGSFCMRKNLYFNHQLVCTDSSCSAVYTLNHAPVANNDYVYTHVDSAIHFSVLNNDYDPDTDIITHPIIIFPPINGTITVAPNKDIVYIPIPGFYGMDSFTYVICDTMSHHLPKPLCDTARCFINVNNCNLTASLSYDSALLKLTVQTSGGTAPYVYTWNTTPATTTSPYLIVNNTQSLYCVSVQDSNGCISTSVCYNRCLPAASITYDTVLHQLTAHASSLCGGPFSYNWSNGAFTQTLAYYLSPGIYCVTIIDGHGNTATACETIVNPCNFTITVPYDSTNRLYTAIPAGGSPPYTYLWNSGDTTQSEYLALNVIKHVNVTDSSGCVVSQQINPVAHCPLTASIKYDSVSHQLSAHFASSCATNLYFHWGNGSGFQDIPYTGSGIYCVTITDSYGTTATACDTIINTCNLSASLTYDSTLHTLSVQTAGGIAPMSYGWNTGQNISPLPVSQSGIYCVNVVDAFACSATVCDTVISNCHLTLTVSFDSATHQVTARTDTGLICRQIDWGDGSTSTVSPAIHLYHTYGTYTITATDCFGCYANYTITVPNLCPLTAHYTFDSINNSYTVTPTVGTPPYLYAWSNGDTTQTIHPGLTPITYVTISDSTGCIISLPVTPKNCHLSVSISYDSVNHFLTANPTNNCGNNFTYQWNNGPTLQSFNPASVPALGMVVSGVFCVTVTDSYGNTATACDTVGAPCQFTLTTAYDSLNGWVNAETPGNTSGKAWTWNNGQFIGYGSSTQGFFPASYTPSTQIITATDSLGCTVSGTYTITYNCFDTICGYVFQDVNANGIKDAGELPLPHAVVFQNNFPYSVDSTGFYQAIIPCYASHYYNTIYANDSLNANQTLPANLNWYNVPHKNKKQCGYNFGFNNNYATVQGALYLDANQNGVKDLAETPIPNQQIHVGSYTTWSDYLGNYSIQVPFGNYAVSCVLDGWYAGYTSVPAAGYTVLSNTPGQILANNDFGIIIPANTQNLAVNVTPLGGVHPGFVSSYSVQVCNVGSMASAGTLNFLNDTNLNFYGCYPTATSQNNTTHSTTWTTTVIAPGSCETYYIHFSAPQTTFLGSAMQNMATVIPTTGVDINMLNNVDTVRQTVTGSFDPNNKFAVETNCSQPNSQYISSIKSNQNMDYVINFQNTGTAPAVNVVVMDTISPDLMISSLQFIGASHPCVVTKNGNILNFKFSNINLPDSGANQVASHGYIKFKIAAKSNLPLGYVIKDEAAIYFDFNSAIFTNDAAVTLIGVSGIQEPQSSATLVLQPNPMSTFTKITLSETNTEGFIFELFDLTGRKISSQITSNNSLNLERNNLESGIYTYTVIQKGRSVAKGKLVVE